MEFLIGIISLILFGIFICVNYCVARKFEYVAIKKGYAGDATHVFIMCFFLGWIGVAYVFALPDLIEKRDRELLIRQISGIRIAASQNAPKD